VIRFGTTKHSHASTDRRACGFTTNGGRRNFDYGIFSDALQFPSRIKSAHKCALTIDSDIHRRTDRSAVTTIRGEQNRSITIAGFYASWTAIFFSRGSPLIFLTERSWQRTLIAPIGKSFARQQPLTVNKRFDTSFRLVPFNSEETPLHTLPRIVVVLMSNFGSCLDVVACVGSLDSRCSVGAMDETE
jgi:hypothetical protein